METSLTTTASVCTGGRANNAAGELTQVYDRLCLASADRINAMFSLFSISLTEKKKKAFLTEELCTFGLVFACTFVRRIASHFGSVDNRDEV